MLSSPHPQDIWEDFGSVPEATGDRTVQQFKGVAYMIIKFPPFAIRAVGATKWILRALFTFATVVCVVQQEKLYSQHASISLQKHTVQVMAINSSHHY